MKDLAAWKTLDRRTVLDNGKFLKVEHHKIELPDGRVIEDWPWVITPDYINVVAETADGRFLVFRQTKYAIDGPTLALVGGYIEPGEEPLAAAQRELAEETGHAADEWIDLGAYRVDANRGAGSGFLFYARGARRTDAAEAAESDDLEEQEMLSLTRAEMVAAFIAGGFKCIAWAAAIGLALVRSGATDKNGS
jgi:ADP-ribose pyrophosphatase